VDRYDHRRAPLRDAPVRTANFPQCASEKQTAWREKQTSCGNDTADSDKTRCFQQRLGKSRKKAA